MIRRPVLHNPSVAAQAAGGSARVVVTVQSNIPLDFSDSNGQRMLALNAKVAALGYETALAFRPELCLIAPKGVAEFPASDMLLRIPQADYDAGVARMGGAPPDVDSRWDRKWFDREDAAIAGMRLATYGYGAPFPMTRAHAMLDVRQPQVREFIVRHALRLLAVAEFRWLMIAFKPDMYGPAPRSLIAPGERGPGAWHALPYASSDYLRAMGIIVEQLHNAGVEMCASSSNPNSVVDPLASLHPTAQSMLAFRAG